MNGASPPPTPPNPRLPNSKSPRSKPPKAVKRRRRSQSLMPWTQLVVLCLLYVGIGLLLSMPEPPAWVWLVTVIAVPLQAMGLTPFSPSKNLTKNSKRKRAADMLSYLGGLLLVIALSVAANYIGSNQNLDEFGVSSALIGLGLLTLLAVILTAASALAIAQVGSPLMIGAQYWRSVTIVIVTSLVGLCVGGITGLSLTASL